MADLVFKVHRPHHEVRTDPEQLLVHDEFKTYHFFYHMNLTQAHKMFGNKFTIFVLGRMQGARFQILKPVDDQEW